MSKSATPSNASSPGTPAISAPLATPIGSSDVIISNKLDTLTSMMMLLAEKTNEALSEVAKLNDRISAQQIPPVGTGSGVNAGFHLDVPKQPKGWKEGPSGKSKGEKKTKSGKTGNAGLNHVDKDVPSSHDVVGTSSNTKKGESDEEDKKHRGTGEDEANRDLSPRADVKHGDVHGESSKDDLNLSKRVSSSSPMRESPPQRVQAHGTFSNRSTLRSRTSMSSIDLNDVQEMEALNTVIKLNVGGRQFCTTRSTLTSVPGTMFEALLSGRHAVVRDGDGAIFLDRDPDIFESLLTYLRDPRQLDLRYFSQQQQMRILCEMDYFMVPFVRMSRDLPYNLTGHTVTVERENQWTMKWTNRGWWISHVDGSHHANDGSASSSNALGAASSQGLPNAALASSSLSGSSLKSGGGAGGYSGSGLASPTIEPPPGLKFIDDLVYVNMKNRPLRAYDLWTGQCLKIIKDSYCDCFAVSSEQLVTYDADDQSLRLWNARASAGISWIKADVPPTNISCLAFINDSMLVLGGDNNKCVTLNLPSGPDLQSTATTVLQGANLRQIEPLSPSVIAVGSTNGNIILWNIKLNVLLGTIPTAQQRITTIFARNNYVYCISPETIKVWDCSTNPSKPSCVATIFDEVSCLDADGDLIVGITADRSRKSLMKVWSLSSSKLVHVMPIPAGETVHTIKVHGNKVATILEDGTVLTWAINLLL
jgi:hypothetical protein